MNRALPILLLTLACGRSESDPATRIAAVTSETSTFVGGHDGVRVSVVVVNEDETTWQLEQASLIYRGTGVMQATRVRAALPVLPPRSTATVSFLVHLPGNGQGAAEIDAEVQIADYEHGVARSLSGAQTPLSFTYEARPPDPDISDLPVLVVTTTNDELDGGDTLADVADAGGAGDLSLREALTLVNNLGTPYRIMFDPAVFPLPTGAEIELGLLQELPTVHVARTAVDGTDAAVTLAMEPTVSIGWFTWTVAAPRAVVRQLTLTLSGYNGGGLSLSRCDDCVLVDVTYDNYDGLVSVYNSRRVRVRRLNVPSAYALTADTCDDLLVEDSYSNGRIELVNCNAAVVRNVQGHGGLIFNLFASPNTWLTGNTLDDIDGYVPVDLSGDCAGSVIADNTFIDCGTWNGAVPVMRVSVSQQVTMSHNLIVRPTSADPIELAAGANADLTPPVVTTAITSTVAGTVSAPDGSLVEVYTDPDDGLERWVGDAVVSGGAFNLSGLSLTSGFGVRALVTDLDGNTSAVSARSEIP